MEHPNAKPIIVEPGSPQANSKVDLLNSFVGFRQFHPEKARSIDPETGYILPLYNNRNANGLCPSYFTPEKKKKFVQIAKDMFPDITSICEMFEISRMTYNVHYQIDKKFRDDMDAIKEKKIDSVEKNMFNFSANPKNFMDRIAILRAYRGDLYNPKMTVMHQKSISDDEASKRRINLENVIDAEVISSSAEVIDSKPVKNLRVPEPLTSKNAIDPAEKGTPMPSSPRSRDPLLDL